MPLYLVDTNIILAYARRRPPYPAVERRYRLSLPSPAPLVSVASVAETRAFMEYRGWGEARQREAETILALFSPVSITPGPLVDAYVELDAFSNRVGREMGKNDLWVASTAMATGAVLLTTDRDFDHLHGLYLLREWIDPAAEEDP